MSRINRNMVAGVMSAAMLILCGYPAPLALSQEPARKPVELPAELPAGAFARLGTPRTQPPQTLFDLSWIKTVAYSADGKRIATSSGHHGVTIWDAESGRKITHFRMKAPNEQAGVDSLSFAPDGKQIAWSFGSLVGVSELASGEELWREKGNLFTMTPDGKFVIATGFYGDSPRLLDAKSGKLVHTLKDGKWWMMNLALSRDGQTLAGVAETGRKEGVNTYSQHRVEIWDLAAGRLRKHIDPPEITVEIRPNIMLSPDGKMVQYTTLTPGFRLGIDGKYQVIFADTHTGKEQPDLVRKPPAWSKVPRNYSGALYSPDFKRKITFGESTALNVWDVAAERVLAASDGNRGTVHQLAFDTAGKTLTSADPFYIYIWDVPTKTLKQRVDAGPRPNIDLPDGGKSTPDRKKVAHIHGDDIHITDSASGNLIQKCVGHKGNIHALSFSGDGNWLLSASHTRPPSRIGFKPDPPKEPAPPIPDETVRLWNVKTGQQIRQWDLSVATAVLTASGSTVFAGTGSKVRHFDAASGKEMPSLFGHQGNVSSLQLSHDGSRVAARDDNAVILLWDAATGKELKRLSGYTAFALSSDGRVLATSLDDSTILLWDVTQRK